MIRKEGFMRVFLWAGSLATALVLFRAEAAPAQTSTALLRSDIRAQYEVVKRTVAKMQAQTLAQKPRLQDRKYDLSTCADAGYYTMEKVVYDDDAEFRILTDLAMNVLFLTNGLTKMGYPPAAWSADVKKHEEGELARIQGQQAKGPDALNELREVTTENWEKFLDKFLVPKLNAYRKSHLSLPQLINDKGCGAGEIAVTIATEPRAEQVLFIPTFFYELCRVQNVNPEDASRCNRWREAQDGQLSEVVGNYMYVARWPDGTLRKGKLSFGSKDDGKTIVLRKP
jgi:hypothetical protein